MVLGWIAILGSVLVAFAATAVKVLEEFSRRELERYAQRRHRLDRFGEILDQYEEITPSLECLQSFGLTLMLLPGGWWLYHAIAGSALPGFVSIGTVVVMGSLVAMATHAWVPRAVAGLWAEPLLFHLWPLWKWLANSTWPLTWGTFLIDPLLRRLADRPMLEEDEEEAFEDEIRSIVTEGTHDGVLEDDTREMIEGVIELADETVSNIMTPRSNVDAVDVCADWTDVLRFVAECGRTRIPVYKDRIDRIVGVLYVKDLLQQISVPGERPTIPLVEILRDPWFVPAAKPLNDMLQEFLDTRKHLAIVMDEYHSVAGVVTIEDVLEEIVGEIVDESDKEEVEFLREIAPSIFEVLGQTHIDWLNERLDLDLPELEDCDTLAGYLLSLLKYIPQEGETLNTAGVRITVLEATRRRIERLRVEVTPPDSGTDGHEP